MRERLEDADITRGELTRILATIIGMPEDKVTGFLVMITIDCPNCGDPDCTGTMAVLNDLQLKEVGDGGPNEPYTLHLIGSLIKNLAEAMRDRR